MAAKIEFTNEQYHALLKLVYLGHWMANSIYEEPDESLDRIENYIYSFYKNFDMDQLIEYSAKMGNFFPTMEFEDAMAEFVDNYDDFVFWRQLAERMARRDLENEIGAAAVETMDYMELTEKLAPRIESYTDEFIDNGIERIFFDKKAKAG